MLWWERTGIYLDALWIHGEGIGVESLVGELTKSFLLRGILAAAMKREDERSRDSVDVVGGDMEEKGSVGAIRLLEFDRVTCSTWSIWRCCSATSGSAARLLYTASHSGDESACPENKSGERHLGGEGAWDINNGRGNSTCCRG